MLEFETLLRRGQAALGGGRESEAIRILRAAIDLYRGGYCADSPYESFPEDEAGQLRHRFRRTLERLVEILVKRRRWDDVVVLCRRGQADDPLSEDFACHLTAALLALGHRQEVLPERHRFEALYVRELDLLPSPRPEGPRRARGLRRALTPLHAFEVHAKVRPLAAPDGSDDACPHL